MSESGSKALLASKKRIRLMGLWFLRLSAMLPTLPCEQTALYPKSEAVYTNLVKSIMCFSGVSGVLSGEACL